MINDWICSVCPFSSHNLNGQLWLLWLLTNTIIISIFSLARSLCVLCILGEERAQYLEHTRVQVVAHFLSRLIHLTSFPSPFSSSIDTHDAAADVAAVVVAADHQHLSQREQTPQRKYTVHEKGIKMGKLILALHFWIFSALFSLHDFVYMFKVNKINFSCLVLRPFRILYVSLVGSVAPLLCSSASGQFGVIIIHGRVRDSQAIERTYLSISRCC